MKKALVTAVYAVGALIALALAGLFLSHSQYVPNPNAMLPMRLYELALVWLAAGTLPMALACVWMRSAYGLRGRRGLPVFLPLLPCAAALVFWLGVWVVGLFNMFVLGQ